MKTLGLFILSLVFLFGCGNDTTTENDLPNNFKISGKIKGAGNQTVYLKAQSDRGDIEVAKAVCDASGSYTMEGNIPGLGIYMFTIGKDERNSIVLPMNANDEVSLSGNAKDFVVHPRISGTKWATPLMQYMQLFSEFSEQQMTVTMKETDTDKQLKLFEEQRKPLENFAISTINKDPSNPVNILLSSILGPSPELGFEGWNKDHLVVLEKMEAAFAKAYPGSPFAAMMSEQLTALKAQLESYEMQTSGKMAAPEISLPNTDNKTVKLSSLKGKVVLIDFWASWCGPCRKENPNVVKLYKKYKSSGFEILSVSLDQDPVAWKKAIKDDGLIWPNHVSDLMGWQTPLTQQYGFNSIPYTVLVNKEGNIIGIGLRGTKLEQKLKELFGK